SSLVGLRQTLAAHEPGSTRWLSLAAMLTTPLGVWILHHIGLAAARLCIAGVSAGATLVLAGGWRHTRPHGPGFILPFGLLAGVLSGLCAMPGPPVLAYYLAVGTPPAAARASMILIFLVTGGLALAGNLWVAGLGAPVLLLAGLCLPAMMAGTLAGESLFRLSGGRHYRQIGLACLVAIAASAALRALL
ncbi:MAG TPA: TSUP family transporter, partial [Novosphingobium sp.]|nr:TSUP family transporter [Novosphingobium sp.]